MSTSPFNRNNSSSMFLNLPSNTSNNHHFYNSQFYSNALRNHFLSPFLLQPLINQKSNPLCLNLSNDSSSPIHFSSPPSSTTTTTNKINSIDEHEQGKIIITFIDFSSLVLIGSNSSEDESSNDRDSKRRRTRTNFTSTQIDELEKAFQEGKLRD